MFWLLHTRSIKANLRAAQYENVRFRTGDGECTKNILIYFSTAFLIKIEKNMTSIQGLQESLPSVCLFSSTKLSAVQK